MQQVLRKVTYRCVILKPVLGYPNPVLQPFILQIGANVRQCRRLKGRFLIQNHYQNFTQKIRKNGRVFLLLA